MSSEKIIPRTVARTVARGLLVVIAATLGACTSPKQKLTLTPESIATPCWSGLQGRCRLPGPARAR